MEKKEKSHLAEVLGVEEDEEWTFKEMYTLGPFRVHNGLRQYRDLCGDWIDGQNEFILEMIINHPDEIIRAPRLTEAERAICKAVGAKWVSRDDITDGSRISLYREKPVKIGNSFFAENAGAMIVSVWDESLFPSVHPGDCICVEEAGCK